MKYFARRPFAHPTENRLTSVGEKIDVHENIGKAMQNKGLVVPAYKTKEDKKVTKVLKKSSDLSLKQVEEWISIGKELDFKGDDRKGVQQWK